MPRGMGWSWARFHLELNVRAGLSVSLTTFYAMRRTPSAFAHILRNREPNLIERARTMINEMGGNA